MKRRGFLSRAFGALAGAVLARCGMEPVFARGADVSIREDETHGEAGLTEPEGVASAAAQPFSLQTAIDAAKPGDTIIVPRAVYWLSAPLTIPHSRLVVLGNQSTVRFTRKVPQLIRAEEGVSNCFVDGFNFICPDRCTEMIYFVSRETTSEFLRP